MPISQFADRHVRAKTREVKNYHDDDARPGKPLYLIVPGGIIALGALALIVYLIYLTVLEQSIEPSQGWLLVGLLAPVYIGSVFVFSYGYELYDVPRALRLTAIIIFLTLSIVIIVAVLLVLASSSKKSSRQSGGSSSGGGKSLLSGIFGTSSSNSSQSFGSRRAVVHLPSVVIGGSNTVTREVIREVPVAPPEPQPIKCGYCGRAYIPKETQYACPSCGASATPEQIAESEAELNQAQNNRTED